MSRSILLAALVAAWVSAPSAMAQNSDSQRTTTVKSSKSNTSDRQGSTNTTGNSGQRATTVKSSKSNTSD
jgi:hypothetical protein